MRGNIVIAAIALASGICISAFAGAAMRSVNVDGRIERISCSNGITSVITSVGQNVRKVYNYDLSGNLLSTLIVSGSN